MDTHGRSPSCIHNSRCIQTRKNGGVHSLTFNLFPKREDCYFVLPCARVRISEPGDEEEDIIPEWITENQQRIMTIVITQLFK